MNTVNIQPQALSDLEEAAAWYEAQQSELGVDFVYEADAAIKRAGTNPLIYEALHREARRVLLRRFPYAIYFVFENSVVEVFAILHQQRAPSDWQNRVP